MFTLEMPSRNQWRQLGKDKALKNEQITLIIKCGCVHVAHHYTWNFATAVLLQLQVHYSVRGTISDKCSLLCTCAHLHIYTWNERMPNECDPKDSYSWLHHNSSVGMSLWMRKQPRNICEQLVTCKVWCKVWCIINRAKYFQIVMIQLWTTIGRWLDDDWTKDDSQQEVRLEVGACHIILRPVVCSTTFSSNWVKNLSMKSKGRIFLVHRVYIELTSQW